MRKQPWRGRTLGSGVAFVGTDLVDACGSVGAEVVRGFGRGVGWEGVGAVRRRRVG